MTPTRVADIRPEWNREYFWRSDTELCFFRHVPREDHPGTFDLVQVDTQSERVADLQPFNTRCGPALTETIGQMRIEGKDGYEVHYITPRHGAIIESCG